MKLNLSGAESFSGFDPIPGGTYHVKITDGELRETKNEGKLPAGTPGVNWEFTVQDGENADRKVWTNQWIHPKTIGFLKGTLEATGKFTEAEINSDDLDVQDAIDRSIGADLTIRVSYRAASEQYDASNDVKSIKKWDGKASQATSGTAAGQAASNTGSLLP
jgi:hypothetical protein